MHITITSKTTNTSTVTGTATAIGCLNIPPLTKRPETETDKSSRIQPVKMNPFSNGVLKRHKPHNHHNVIVAAAAAAAGMLYKDCLKNHAATIGGHAVDGCGEFMPSPAATFTDPTSIRCVACGCHRNFHRCESNGGLVVEYSPQHRHYPLPPPASTPHTSPCVGNNATGLVSVNFPSRKRFRTKFSQEQKEKMLEFAAKVGWKIQNCKQELVSGFCNEIGVQRGVFKVWMHNNKSTSFLNRRSGNTNYENTADEFDVNRKNNNIIITNNNNNNNNNNNMEEDEEHVNGNTHSSSSSINSHTNASSSSS